jgi:hypothetical protein
MRLISRILVLQIGLVFAGLVATCSADDVDRAIEILRKVEKGNAENQKAVEASKLLQAGRASTLIRVLEGMKDATSIGKNYLSGVAGALQRKDSIYLRSQLQSFLEDQRQDAEARYLVFEWLTDNDSKLREEMLANFQNDSSLEIRYAAIELAKQKLAKSEDIRAYEELLDAARHPAQIESIAKKLKGLGQNIDQAKIFGFLMTWSVIGPFDNVGQKHFHTVYEVEQDLLGSTFDPEKQYVGKSGQVTWQTVTTDQPDGVVDLAEIYNQEKGAIAYARTVFVAESACEVEIRFGTKNANKLWVNDQDITMNEVYHAGMSIDQYIAKAKLVAGENEIVLKLCQNEQTESWAQEWRFQVRVSDSTGKAVLEANR